MQCAISISRLWLNNIKQRFLAWRYQNHCSPVASQHAMFVCQFCLLPKHNTLSCIYCHYAHLICKLTSIWRNYNVNLKTKVVWFFRPSANKCNGKKHFRYENGFLHKVNRCICHIFHCIVMAANITATCMCALCTLGVHWLPWISIFYTEHIEKFFAPYQLFFSWQGHLASEHEPFSELLGA